MSARRDFGGSQNCLSQKGQGALPINLQQQKSDPSLQGAFSFGCPAPETASPALGVGKQIQAHWAFGAGAGAGVAEASDP